MMKAFTKYSLLLFAFALLILNVSAQKERKHIRNGNEEYHLAINDTGAVDTIVMQKAELNYRKALDEDIYSYEAGFNLGNSLFKQQKFDEAHEQYELLVDKAEGKDELAEVFYNIGNAQLAGGKLEESIESYKQSLRMNPKDTAAKYNLAVAQKLKNEAKPQEQQQQQDQNHENNEDQEKQDQEQQQDQQSQEQQEQEQQQQEQQEQQQAQEKEGEEEEKEQQQMQKKDEISKEDAERMLKVLEQDEKKVLQKLQEEKSKRRPKKLEKDW